MKPLWAPWRMEFIERERPRGCIFCTFPAEARDRENLILGRSEHSFAILNKFPYNSGHLMVIPRRHTGDFTALPEPVAQVPDEWPSEPGNMYFRASIIEQLPNPLTPLFADLMAEAVPSSLQALMDELGMTIGGAPTGLGGLDIGFPTVNGYAGNEPRGWAPLGSAGHEGEGRAEIDRRLARWTEERAIRGRVCHLEEPVERMPWSAR